MSGQNRLLRHAAGQLKTLHDVEDAIKYFPSLAVVRLGAYTEEDLGGNKGTVEVAGTTAYGNAIGLKNGGINWLRQEFQKIYDYCKECGIRIIVNIAGLTVAGNVALATFFAQFPDLIVEFNAGCPNGEKRTDGLPAVPVYLSTAHMAIHMTAIASACPNDLAYKPGPILDSGLLAEQAQFIKSMRRKIMLCPINTIGTCMPVTNGRPEIGVKFCGGSGGELMRWLGFGQTHMWRLALGDDFEIDAHGGIQHGDHVVNYIEGAGATYCSVGADFRKHPKASLRDIASDIRGDLLAKYAL